MIALSGIAASVAASASIAHGDSNDARRAFDAMSEGIAARLQLGLQLGLQHQDDLVVNAAALVVTNAAATQAQFRNWATTAHVLDR